MKRHNAIITLLVILLPCVLAGCGASAHVDMAAADLGDRIAETMTTSLNEYHHEVVLADDNLEAAIAAAFVERVKADVHDAAALEVDRQQFMAASQRIRANREVEWERRAKTAETVAMIREMSTKLRKLAMDSLSLDDEMRRYITGWLDSYKAAKERKVADAAAAAEQKRENINGIYQFVRGTVLPAAGVNTTGLPAELPKKGGSQ